MVSEILPGVGGHRQAQTATWGEIPVPVPTVQPQAQPAPPQDLLPQGHRTDEVPAVTFWDSVSNVT